MLSSLSSSSCVREANINDVPIIYKFIRDLAEYEKALDDCVLTENDLLESLFPSSNDKHAAVFANVAVNNDNVVVGMAIWHLNYSTWLGKHGIYLEDLYVDPTYRNQNYGKALLISLAAICKERGYQRLQWWCLNWNKNSIEFYKSIGAVPQDEWTVFRVDDNALESLSSMQILIGKKPHHIDR